MGKIFGSYRFKSPVGSKLTSPLANGNKVERLKKKHAEVLEKHMGMREPRNPVW